MTDTDTITLERYESSRPDLAGVTSVTQQYETKPAVGRVYETHFRTPDPRIQAKARLVLLRVLAADRRARLPAYQRAATQADQADRHAVYLAQVREMPQG